MFCIQCLELYTEDWFLHTNTKPEFENKETEKEKRKKKLNWWRWISWKKWLKKKTKMFWRGTCWWGEKNVRSWGEKITLESNWCRIDLKEVWVKKECYSRMRGWVPKRCSAIDGPWIQLELGMKVEMARRILERDWKGVLGSWCPPLKKARERFPVV